MLNTTRQINTTRRAAAAPQVPARVAVPAGHRAQSTSQVDASSSRVAPRKVNVNNNRVVAMASGNGATAQKAADVTSVR